MVPKVRKMGRIDCVGVGGGVEVVKVWKVKVKRGGGWRERGMEGGRYRVCWEKAI